MLLDHADGARTETLAHLAHQEVPELLAQKAALVHPEVLDATAALGHLVPLAVLETKAEMVTPAQLVTKVGMRPQEAKATMEQLVPVEMLERLVVTAIAVVQAILEQQETLDHKAMPDNQAQMETKDHQAQPDQLEDQARMPNIALALTVRRKLKYPMPNHNSTCLRSCDKSDDRVFYSASSYMHFIPALQM